MDTIIKEISRNYALFALPTFISGIASCFDLYGTLNSYRYSGSAKQADFEEIKSDWETVGLDINIAIEKERCSNVKAA